MKVDRYPPNRSYVLDTACFPFDSTVYNGNVTCGNPEPVSPLSFLRALLQSDGLNQFGVEGTGPKEVSGNRQFLVMTCHTVIDVCNLLVYACYSSRISDLFKGIPVV